MRARAECHTICLQLLVRNAISPAVLHGEDTAMHPTKGYRALRKGRVSISGQLYLITFVTRGRQPIFRDFRLASVAACTLESDAFWLSSNVFCWVLMPDHWHGLVQLDDGRILSRCVNRAKTASALRVNKVRGTKGPVWQPGFHDHAVRRHEDLKQLARYVVANPLRAGLVSDIRQYPFWDAVWL